MLFLAVTLPIRAHPDSTVPDAQAPEPEIQPPAIQEAVQDTASHDPVPASPSAAGRSTAYLANLRQRDINAIEYTRSLLLEGDTLVYIRYPKDQQPYDPSGFVLSSNSHRVHSQKLLATGSEVFRKLLDERAQQRARNRAGYSSIDKLPQGIRYILDLTPPDEGDDAVDLLSNLSCSAGIRWWHRTARKIGVDRKLTLGKDEYLRPPSYDTGDENSPHSPTGPEDPYEREVDVPEYCPVRHRAGIERVLRIIEGRDPKLDSAPKVLTLAFLGKYFDCTNVVVCEPILLCSSLWLLNMLTFG